MGWVSGGEEGVTEYSVGSHCAIGSKLSGLLGVVVEGGDGGGRRRLRRWASDCHRQLPRRRRLGRSGDGGSVLLRPRRASQWRHLRRGGGARRTSAYIRS